MTKTLESTDRTALEGVQDVDNDDSRLPVPGIRNGRTITSPPGSPGWTMRVHDITGDGAGNYSYPVSDELAQEIADAKAKLAQDRTAREEKLAAAPEPKEPTPIEPKVP